MQKIGKEVKIGLAVVGVLAVAFGYVLVKKIANSGDSSSAADQTAAATASTATTSAPAPAKPTIVAATEGDHLTGLGSEDSKRNRWTLGGRTASDADSKGADPAADSKNPFAPTAREAIVADSGSAALSHERIAEAPNRLPDSARRQFAADEGRDGGPPGSAVQASDMSQVQVNGDGADKNASSSPSVFGRSSRFAADKPDHAGEDKAAAAEKTPSDPFQRRLADSSPPADPFNRRPAADLPPPSDPFNHKGSDAMGDSHGGSSKLTDERSGSQSSGLTPVNDSPFKHSATTGNSLDSQNPLRHEAENQTSNANSTEAGRFQSRNPEPTTGSTTGLTVTTRDAGSLAPATHWGAGGGGTAAQPLTADDAPKPGTYTVEPNDNYWTISQKVYGDGGYFKAIYQHNSRQHPKPERLQVGEVLQVPDAATLQKLYPDLCPKPGHSATAQRITPASARIRPGTKVYVVEEGDTLFKIAKDQLGSPSKWGQVYQLNRDVLRDYDYLKPGTELLLPTGETRSDPIARQPGGPINQ